MGCMNMEKVYEQIKKDLIENLEYSPLSDYTILCEYILEKKHNTLISYIYCEMQKMYKHIVIEIENSSVLIDISIETNKNEDEAILISKINNITIDEI